VVGDCSVKGYSEVSKAADVVFLTLGLAIALQMGCLGGILFMYVAQGQATLGAPPIQVLGAHPNLPPDMAPFPPTSTPTGAATTSPVHEATPTLLPPPTFTRVIPLTTPTSVPPPPTPTQVIAQPEAGPANVIIVIWDGTQRAHLLEMLYAGRLPNLQALINQSGRLAWPIIDSTTCRPGSGDGYRTETGPANAAIATGWGYPGMGNWTNAEPHPIPDGLTLWEWFKWRGYITGIVSSKDEPFWPQPALNNASPEIDYWMVGHHPQSWVTDGALSYVQTNSRSPFFLWVHYKEPDTEGHRAGENSEAYSQSLVIDDQELGRLVAALRWLGIADQTVLVVTTDHGFNEAGLQHDSCGPDTKDLFLATSENGSALLRCISSQTDIAPCTKALMEPQAGP
jgi:hypothetical protein